jgi:DnaA family protein
MRGQQLALSVQLRESASFDSFFSGPNAAAVTALRDPQGCLLLYGAVGSGRTHLLQAVARAQHCPYLPMAEIGGIGPDVLEGLEHAALLCLDDLDAVCNRRDWALALLRLLDQRHALGSALIIASNTPPDRMEIALPDLRTRLMRAAIFGLKPLTDDDRTQFLRERAQARGLDLAPEVSRWLLTQLARDTGSLLAALEQLDRASLSAKRRLTLPFVQTVLAQSALSRGTSQTD